MSTDEPDWKVTTVRLPRNLHERVKKAADKDLRTFNAEVQILLEVALASTAPREDTPR